MIYFKNNSEAEINYFNPQERGEDFKDFWDQVLSYLSVNDVSSLSLSCKFFSTLTNKKRTELNKVARVWFAVNVENIPREFPVNNEEQWFQILKDNGGLSQENIEKIKEMMKSITEKQSVSTEKVLIELSRLFNISLKYRLIETNDIKKRNWSIDVETIKDDVNSILREIISGMVSCVNITEEPIEFLEAIPNGMVDLMEDRSVKLENYKDPVSDYCNLWLQFYARRQNSIF